MATTPPPPGRIHTPPTPRHGPMFDDYEPYSPRRSTRVQQQNHNLSHSPTGRQVLSKPPAEVINATPRRAKNHSASQTLSPPTSPEHAARKPRPGVVAEQSAAETFQRSLIEDCGQHLGSHHDDATDSVSMLPTPRKTPSKQRISSRSVRGLDFQAQPSRGLISTPRRQKIRATLHSPQASAARVKVYTDSRDCVPDMNDDEDNPFVGPRKKPTARARPRRYTREEREMMARAGRDEGQIWNLRGRMLFRAYEANSEIPLHSHDPQTRRLTHMAGAAADRPLTRSSLQPRTLFQESAEFTEPTDTEELTEIEEQSGVEDHVSDKEDHLSKGYGAWQDEELSNQHSTIMTASSSTPEIADDTPLGHVHASHKQAKKPSPFDSWKRSKSSSQTSQHGTKRAAAESPVGEPLLSKRTRSGAAAGAR